MANNPLYPGHSPKKPGEESVNPLYPGYYPGQPVNKRPSSKNIIKPIEYNFDFLMEQIDEIGNEVANTPLGPKWVKDRIIDDWKEQLKVSISPTSNVDVTDLDDYATDDLAGATTSLSLDRKKWGIGEKDGWEQTKKQVGGTLKAWLKETTGINADNILESDFSDIKNKANQELWLAALGYGEEKLTSLQKSGVEAISDRTTAYFGNFDSDSKGKGSVLNLKGVDAVEVVEVEVKDETGQNQTIQHKIIHDDLYAKTAKAAADFEMSKDSARERDKGHNTFLSEAFHAMDVEIQDKVGKYGEGSKSINKHSSAVDFFHTKAETLRDIEEFQKTAIKNATKKLDQDAINKLEVDINKLEKRLSEHSQKTRELISRGIPEDQINKFLGETSKYQEHLNYLKEEIKKVEKGKIGFERATKIIGGATPDKNFTSRTTFQNDLGGNLRKDLERSTLSTKSYDIGSLLNDPDLASENINFRAKNLAPVLHRLRQDRIHFATREVLTAFDKGGLSQVAEQYVWSKVKAQLPKRLEMISSGEVVGEYLKKRNYFGLRIVDEGIPVDPDKLKRFERKFGYKVDVDLDSRLKGIAGLDGKIKVSGLEVSPNKNVYSIFNKRGIDLEKNNLEILNDKKNLKLLNFNDKDFRVAEENRVLFAKLLNNDRSDETKNLLANKLFNKNLSELDQFDIKEMNTFLGKIDSAGGWVEQKTGGKIKILPMQTGTVVLLDKAAFGVEKVTLLNGNHLNVFSNKNTQLFLQKNLDNKTKDEQIQQLKKLLRIEGEKGYGEASLNKIVKLTTGKDFLALSRDEQDTWFALASEFKNFSEWVKTQKNVFGDQVDNVDFRLKLFLRLREEKFGLKPVDVDSTNPAFLLFQSVFNKNELLADGYKLTDIKFIGTLQKINKKMQELQKKWEKTKLGQLIKRFNVWKQVAAEKLAAFVSKALAKLLGATAAATGILATLMPVIQALAEKLIQKGVNYAVVAIKGILKLNFKDLETMLNKDLKHITQGILFGCAWITVILIIPIVGIFGTFSSVTAPVDYTRNDYEGYGEISDAGEPKSAFGCSLCAGAGECKEAYLANGCINCYTPGDGIGGFYYSQKDPRWEGESLDGSLSTIGRFGCFATSIAMVYKYFGDSNTTPLTIAKSDRVVECPDTPGLIACIADPSVEGAEMVDVDPSEGEMIQFFIDHPGGIIILKLLTGEKGSSTQHFVVISGWNGTDFILYDPIRGPDACLSREYEGIGWGDAWGYYQEGNDVCIPIDEGGGDDGCDCTDKVPNNDLCNKNLDSGDEAANRALDIVCDLKKGVDCYYNKPGENMPEMYSHADGNLLWNAELIKEQGCESENGSHDGYIYFWCTWLIKKSYGELSAVGGMSLGAAEMCSGLQHIDNHIDNVQVGDVTCFWVTDEVGNTFIGHVGIVWSVDTVLGSITVLQSNGPETKIDLFATDDGRINPYMVAYFGRR